MNLTNEIKSYLERLFPICRSLTGDGNRETFRILKEIVPLNTIEYKSGSKVYDWTIPDEWNVRDAWIKDSVGNKLVDFSDTNLHLVGYSEPIHRKMHFVELAKHLHVHQNLTEHVPYRTSYYERNWGFCVTEKQLLTLSSSNGKLEVFVDSKLDPKGSLTIGELLIPGHSEKEILISTYICHPSLANDNLSGVVMTAFLAREILKKNNLNYSYRILWVPETIGAISYCAMNESEMKKIQCGMVVTTVGGPGNYGYKQSYNSKHSINLAIEEIFRNEGIEFITYPFDIHGSDERQYSSQGFRINVASVTKDKYYEYPYYHSSADDLKFVCPKRINQSMKIYSKILDKLDREKIYKNKFPNCEVMLSKHGLYPKIGGNLLPIQGRETEIDTILSILWMSDGKTGVYEIANNIKVNEGLVISISADLCSRGIMKQLA